MYFIYLNRLRSEIFNFVKKAIISLKKISSTEINLNKKEIQSLLINEINPLIYERMPFLTIEQLTLAKYSDKNNLLRVNNFQEKDLDLDIKPLSSKDNKIRTFNISSECKYYKFSERYELNESINLDDSNFENENLFDKNNILDNFSSDVEDFEEIINTSFVDFNLFKNDLNNYEKIEISREILILLNWSEWLDFSLSCQLKKITNEINNILFFNKLLKKKISDEFLDYISDNNFLVNNPFPFINLFDLNNKEFYNFDGFEQTVDSSKIYFFNLNTTEIEFFDINLNTIRNKITDLKYQLNLLIKKEKYWNNKKLCTQINKSIINKI